jgi:hypothetical protein
MESLINHQKRIIMDWSPKAGCTVLTKMFFRNMGLLEEALSFDPWVHEYRMKVFSVNHPVTRADYKNPEFYRFKVVRNPYSRVVSSYIMVMKDARLQYLHKTIKKTLWRWNVNISFSTFVKFLSKVDIKSCDPHYSQQKKYFEDEIADCFDQVIKLENLNGEIAELNRRKSLDFDLTGLTSWHHTSKNENIKENVAKKPWSKIKDRIPHYGYFYTDELIEKVYKIYKEDFTAYNYSYDDFIKLEAVSR